MIVNVSAFDVPPPGVGFTTVIAAAPELAISAAAITAVNCVALTNVVVRAPPFHCATDPPMKFVPFNVSVNAVPPAPVVGGESDVSVGTGFAALIVNVSEFDVIPAGAPSGFAPPPRFTAGVNTVTEDVPTPAISAAPIAAVNCVALANVVARALPFHCTTEVPMKLLPFSVNVNAVPPAIAEFGAREPNDGIGVVMLNCSESELPPPGAGFRTLTFAKFAVCTSAAVIAAVNCVALTNVVVRALPFHCTTDAPINPLPFTVIVNAPEPALTVFGVTEFATGCGLFVVKVTAFDAPPPGAGFITMTAGDPAAATSPAKIAAVSCVALTNVVTRAAPPKFTTDVFRKFVPFTVRVNAPDPAITFAGKSVVTVGTGFGAALILKFTAFDVPPPGIGLVTVTAGVPTVVTSLERIAAVS